MWRIVIGNTGTRRPASLKIRGRERIIMKDQVNLFMISRWTHVSCATRACSFSCPCWQFYNRGTRRHTSLKIRGERISMKDQVNLIMISRWTHLSRATRAHSFLSMRAVLYVMSTDARLLIEMKTERKWTKLSATTFVFIFFCRSGNEYRNPGNE